MKSVCLVCVYLLLAENQHDSLKLTQSILIFVPLRLPIGRMWFKLSRCACYLWLRLLLWLLVFFFSSLHLLLFSWFFIFKCVRPNRSCPPIQECHINVNQCALYYRSLIASKLLPQIVMCVCMCVCVWVHTQPIVSVWMIFTI